MGPFRPVNACERFREHLDLTCFARVRPCEPGVNRVVRVRVLGQVPLHGVGVLAQT